ncbi:diguanylate cyclase domain-containing protein [Ewingella americana]|uniref:Diguanylate cyclase n=1 Tax=Ewingella americana TaxID=41202 RepID=A0A502GJE1_9GAMM|nr:diguanylate cyclase [Ewingella americana]TPG61985.1 diguanylate cyclase [Ewingella americana]
MDQRPSISADDNPGTRPSLSRELNRIHMMVVLLGMGLAGFLLTVLALIALRSQANFNLHLTARAIGYTSEAAVVFNDKPAARDTLELIATNEDFYQAKILTVDGKVLAEWQRPQTGTWDKLGQLVGHLAFPMPITLPILHANQQIGTVWLAGDGASLIGFLLKVIIGLLASLLLTAVVAFTLSRRMVKRIVGSLQNITDVTHAVSANRTFNLRAPSAPIAELHTLSCDFNSLLTEMETWQNHLKIENDSLAHKAQHDSLTGLRNRAFFIDTLNQCYNPLRPQTSLALLFIDVDNFKEINDSLGHAAGDKVLIDIGVRLGMHLQENALLARLGGDEFAVLLQLQDAALPESSVEEKAISVAQNIVKGMQEPLTLRDGKTLLVSLSIGIALTPAQAANPKELLERADEAMYRSKKFTGSCWHLADHAPLTAVADPH